jgi:type 1 glutamine amidotransferase
MNYDKVSSMKRLLVSLVACLLIASAAFHTPAGFATAKPSFRLLVFTKTTGHHHDSIPEARDMVRKLAAGNNFTADFTDDASTFNDANLAKYAAVMFLLTTGELLNPEQQAAFERYIRAGHGYVGVHAAADAEYDWPFYGELLGAYFKNHPMYPYPEVQKGVVHVEDPTHPSTYFLPKTWVRTDEWYNYRTNPRGKAHILLTLDESTYKGANMGPDHPIAWCQNYAGGRSWYTGLGHTIESYHEPLFMRHVLGGIQWAAGAKPGRCEVAAPK